MAHSNTRLPVQRPGARRQRLGQALLSMPGMRDAIHADLAEPLAACAKTLDR